MVASIGVLHGASAASAASREVAASSSSPNCPLGNYDVENGASATPVVTEVPTGYLYPNSCDGPFGVAVSAAGDLFVSDQMNGNLYRFPSTGGAAGPRDYLGDQLKSGAYDLVFARDGDLYGVRPHNPLKGEVVQVNPVTGVVERVVTNQLEVPTWIAVDPRNGALFVTNGDVTPYFSPDLWEIERPWTPTPTVRVFATNSAGYNQVAVAPNGAVYALTRANQLIRYSTAHTSSARLGRVVASVPPDANGGLALGPSSATGAPRYVFVSASDIDRINLRNGRVTPLVVASDTTLSPGQPGYFATISLTLGRDGCLYAPTLQTVLRISGATGLCSTNSDLAGYVPTPGEVPWNLRSVAQSWFWVAALLVLIGASSTLFNATLSANFEEISGWLAPLRRRARKNTSKDPGVTEWRGWPRLGLYLLLAGVVYTVRSPSLNTFAGFTIGVAAGSLASMEVTRRWIARRRTKVGRPVAHPSTLLVALFFVACSALASAKPGYVFGIVFGLSFVPKLDDREAGAYGALQEGITFVIGLAAWFLRWPLAYGLSAHPSGLHRFVADSLAVIFVSAVCSLAFGMAPLRFLTGEKVRAWHQGAWIVLWLLGLFALVHVLESGYGYASATQERLPTLVLGVALWVLSVAFWSYFRWRRAPTPGVPSSSVAPAASAHLPDEG
jgi:hypothetical protein